MTTYTRSPNKATVKCTVPGCKWVKTYFDLQTRHSGILEVWPAELRARFGLTAHVGAKHSGVQHAQSLRPVQR